MKISINVILILVTSFACYIIAIVLLCFILELYNCSPYKIDIMIYRKRRNIGGTFNLVI